MISLRLFVGYTLQIMPFAFLSLYHFQTSFRFSTKKTVLFTIALIMILSTTFSIICLYLTTCFPASPTLYLLFNGVFMCCLVPCMLWYLYVVRERWQNKLFIFFFTLTSALMMTSFCNVIETKLQLKKNNVELLYSNSYLLCMVVVMVLILPPLSLLLKKMYLPMIRTFMERENNYLPLLSMSLFLLLAVDIIPIDYASIFNPISLFMYFTLFLTIFLVYVTFFHLFVQSQKRLCAEAQLFKRNHLLEIYGEQFKRTHKSMEDSRKIRHDTRHHIVTIQGLLKEDDIDKAKAYLNDYAETLNDDALLILCENKIVNTITNHYKMIALEKNIDFIMHLAIPENISIKDTDLSILIGNLLENAIEGASQIEVPSFIRFNMKCSGKMLIITIDNSFNGKVIRNNNSYLSTKRNSLGVGLKSIEDIAKKYHGVAEFNYKNCVFYSSIMLHLDDTICCK